MKDMHAQFRYYPELDASSESYNNVGNFYMLQFSLLWWVIELRRIDVTTETVMLYSHITVARTPTYLRIPQISYKAGQQTHEDSHEACSLRSLEDILLVGT